MKTQGIIDWVQQFSSEGNTTGKSIKVSNTGDIYITGGFDGQVLTLYSIDGKNKQLTSTNTHNGFLAKYNSSGAIKWAVPFYSRDPIAYGIGNGVVISDNNDVYITGNFSDSVTFYSTDETTISTNGTDQADGFLVKYNHNGIVQWSVSFNSTETLVVNGGNSISISNNDVYITGGFGGSVTFSSYNSDIKQTITGSGGLASGYLSKYSSDGIVQWVAPFYSDDQVNKQLGLSVIVNNNSVYVTGIFDLNIVFYSVNSDIKQTIVGNGISDGFLAKYNTSGILQWATGFYGSKPDNYDCGFGVAVSSTYDVYVTGRFGGSVTFYSANSTKKKTISGNDKN
jgi:hypothetical protein